MRIKRPFYYKDIIESNVLSMFEKLILVYVISQKKVFVKDIFKLSASYQGAVKDRMNNFLKEALDALVFDELLFLSVEHQLLSIEYIEEDQNVMETTLEMASLANQEAENIKEKASKKKPKKKAKVKDKTPEQQAFDDLAKSIILEFKAYLVELGIKQFDSNTWFLSNLACCKSLLKSYGEEEVREGVEFFMKDEFWSSKIDSFVAIRKHWPKYILDKNKGKVKKEEAGDVRDSIQI